MLGFWKNKGDDQGSESLAEHMSATQPVSHLTEQERSQVHDLKEPGSAASAKPVSSQLPAPPSLQPFPQESLDECGYLPDTEAPQQPASDHLLPALQQVQASVQELEQAFKDKLQSDRSRDMTIERLRQDNDRLHQELMAYKNEAHTQHIKPVLLDVIQLIDDLNQVIHKHTQTPHEQLDPTKLLEQMREIPTDLKDMLYRQGVDAYDSAHGTFNAEKQKLVTRLNTQDPGLDKQVAAQLRPGYEWNGKVLRPEWVSVYVFSVPSEARPPQTNPQI